MVHIELINFAGLGPLAPIHQGFDDLPHPSPLLGNVRRILVDLLVPITVELDQIGG